MQPRESIIGAVQATMGEGECDGALRALAADMAGSTLWRWHWQPVPGREVQKWTGTTAGRRRVGGEGGGGGGGAIIGHSDILRLFEETIVWPRGTPRCTATSTPQPNPVVPPEVGLTSRLLLYGPPGTGRPIWHVYWGRDCSATQ